MNSQRYKHQGNGRIYAIMDGFDFNIKQTSDNEWEPSVVYICLSTEKICCTGESRFYERFEEVEQ